MKKYLKWCLLSFLALALVLVSAQPWNWTNASADETVPIVVTKVWNDNDNADGSRPDSVTMQINQNGTLWRTVELTEEDRWTMEITDAPLRDGSGSKYEYTLTEEVPDGYTSRIQKTEPEDITRFTVDISPETEAPFTGDTFRYAVTVENDSTYDGILNVTATFGDKVAPSSATDNGTVNGNTVEWTGLTIPSNGTKILYVTAMAGENGSVSASATASINGRSATGTCEHDIQRHPELNVFRMEVHEKPNSVESGKSATVTWKITVRGDEGAQYVISDPLAEVISGNLKGTIGADFESVIYVSCTSTAPTDLGPTTLGFVNSATIYADGDTIIADTITEKTVASGVDVSITWPKPETLSVVWVDDNGTILKTDTFEKGSAEPVCSIVPTKAEDDNYTYSFKDWVRSEDSSGNVTYTASYNKTEKPKGPVTYLINWYNSDGSIFKSDTRTGNIGDTVSVTEADKVVDDKVFLASRSKTLVKLAETNNVLKLYFMDYVECFNGMVSEPTVITQNNVTISTATYGVQITNTSGTDVYGLHVRDERVSAKGISYEFRDFALDGSPITPVSGGASDLVHIFDLISDDTAFRSGQSVVLTYTIVISFNEDFDKTADIDSHVYCTSLESPVTRAASVMTLSLEEPQAAGREPIRFTVTNSHTPEEKTSVNVSIVWNDENDKDGRRPESVDVNLLRDGNTIKTLTLNEANHWSHTETGLARYIPGTDIEYMYAARQTNVPDGYTADLKVNGTDITITNKHEVQTEPDPVPATYTIRYNLDGGKLNGNPVGFAKNGDIYSVEVSENSARPDLGFTPEKEHYTFAGWYPALPDTITGNATYTAKWEPREYTISYALGYEGYTGNDVFFTVAYGEATPEYPGIPERDGYVFIGWTPAVQDTVSDSMTYTAQWEEKAPDVHVHTKGSEKVIKEATCMETGTSASVCIICNETYGEYTVPALGHSQGEEKVLKEATCTEAGSKAYTCSRCGKTYSETAIAALGHAPGKETVTKEPTCTEAGTKAYTCTRCGESLNGQPVAALGHSDLTYTDNSDGTHTGTCDRCSKAVTTEPHVFGGWKESGSKMERSCTICGATETKDKDAAKYTVSYSVNGSVSTKFYNEGTKILVEECLDVNDSGHFVSWTWNGREYKTGDTVTVEGNINFVAKLEAHTFEDHTQAGSCTEDGFFWRECTLCDYRTDKMNTGHTGHVLPEAWTDNCSGTDEHCEKHVKSCTVCGKAVDSEDHSYGEWDTKTEGGYTVMERTCACGHKQTVKVQTSVSTTYTGKARPITKAAAYEGVMANIHNYKVDFTYLDAKGDYVGGDPKDAGVYTAVLKFMAGGKEIVSADIAYEIQPAVLVATYKSETISVNGSFKGTVEVDGFMHDDTSMPDFEFPDIKTDGIDWTKPGTYTITPYGGKVNGNYVFQYVSGTLTIVDGNQAAVTYPALEEDPVKVLTAKTDTMEAGTWIVVDLDGGTWEPEDSVWKENSGQYEYTLVKGSSITLYSDPAKNGYLFMGWKRATNGSTVTYTAHWGEISAAAGELVYNSEMQAPEIKVSIHGTEIGAEQFAVTDYRDKDGKSLGADTQDDPIRPIDAGTYTAEVAVKDALGAPVCVVDVEFTIQPAKLTVKTESATKEYDGKELTAEGTVEGLMGSDKAQLKVTGSQTEAGSSVNTYEIIWATAKASNYEIVEELGTLAVTKDGKLPDEGQAPDDTDNTLEVKASINWMDVRDYDKLRPEYLAVNLYQDGKLYLTGTTDADTDWGYTFKVDKADKDGKAYKYTVMVKAPKGYEIDVKDYEITLKHVPVTNISINVTWNDKNNKDKVRPTEAELVIYQNDKAFRTLKATSKNGWKLSVKDLPKFDEDYKEYSYSLGYDKVPENYTAAIKGLSVTYTHEVKASTQTTTKPTTNKNNTTTTQKPSSTTKPNGTSGNKTNKTDKDTVSGNSVDKDKGEVVKTGENDFLLLSILGLAALSGGAFAIYWKKRGSGR